MSPHEPSTSAANSRGVWIRTNGLTSSETAALANEVEAHGYDRFWFPEIFGRGSFVNASWLLANTTTLKVATGIANIYLREPFATLNAARALAEQSGGRFVLGLGSSHNIMVQLMLAKEFKPATDLEAYITAIIEADHSGYDAPQHSTFPEVVIAALGPRLIDFAAKTEIGVHSYMSTPEQTASTRDRLGPNLPIYAELKVVLTDDPAKDRAVAREGCAFYLALESYQKNMRRVGFSDDDIANGGSDRLVDHLVAVGNRDLINSRIAEFYDAGATHVCIQPLNPDGSNRPDVDALAQLAPNSL